MAADGDRGTPQSAGARGGSVQRVVAGGHAQGGRSGQAAMIPLFLGLTTANLTALLAAIALGYTAVGNPAMRGWHTLAGVMATIGCVAVHCTVFTYFIATS